MSKIYDEFKAFRDQFGMNQLDQNSTSQNGALFTMEYLICLLADDTATDAEKQAEIARLIDVYKALEVFPGVSVRYPGSTEFDSMDNTGAIASFSGIFDKGGYSQRSYDHGNETYSKDIDENNDKDKNAKYITLARIVSALQNWSPAAWWRYIKSGFGAKFFWNNNDPSKFCTSGWHGRSPGHVAYLKMTAGKLVGPIGFLSVLIGQFIGVFAEKGNADARKLPYVSWQFLKNRSFIWKLAYKLWCHILIKQYPNGMLDVYKIYYNNPDHPIKKYSKPFVP